MKLAFIFCAALMSISCASQAQKPMLAAPNMVEASQVEGLGIRHRGVNMTVLGNVTVSRKTTNDASSAALGRVGDFEIAKSSAAPSASSAAAAPNARPNMAQDRAIPYAAPSSIPNESAFLGVIYQNDSQEMGLIGKEITLKFKSGKVPSTYQSLAIKELVPGAKVFLLTVRDLNQWLTLLPQLEADSEVSLVEANIVTSFKRAQ